jgi:4-aminobutyrate aminotransferase-like enzyme
MDMLSPVWSRMTKLQPVRGEGIYLYGKGGERYVDFTSGIGVTNTGHCHPKVVKIQRKKPSLTTRAVNRVRYTLARRQRVFIRKMIEPTIRTPVAVVFLTLPTEPMTYSYLMARQIIQHMVGFVC